MPVFEYVARDSSGRAVRGRAQAQDRRELVALLRRQGLFLTSVETHPDGVGTLEPVPLKSAELADFSHHMAALLGAGLTLFGALQAVEEHADSDGLRRFARGLREEVERGTVLSAALERVGREMPAVFVGVVQSGEATGRLDLAFQRLSAYLERELEFRRKVREALAYPAVVMAAAAVVVAVFLVYVVPAFERVYRSAGASLPPLTQMLLTLSRGIRVVLPATLPALALVLVPQARARVRTRLLPLAEGLLEALPRAGDLVRLARSARFLHSVGSSLAAGVPLLGAIGIAASAAGRPQWVPVVRGSVEAGRRLSEALKEVGELPALAVRLVGLGEESGSLAEMVLRAAEVLERDFEIRMRRLLAALEPALTVGLAVVVGVILLALYLPIFGLGRAVLGP